jgi:hypothetical protein
LKVTSIVVDSSSGGKITDWVQYLLPPHPALRDTLSLMERVSYKALLHEGECSLTAIGFFMPSEKRGIINKKNGAFG